MNKVLIGVLLAGIALAGRGGEDYAAPTVQPPTSCTTSATPRPGTSASAGDLAACKGYGRACPALDDVLEELARRPRMADLIALFEDLADDLEKSAGTANDPVRVAALAESVGGIRGYGAMVESKHGDAGREAAARVLRVASGKVARFCNVADTSWNYQPNFS